FVVRSGLRPLNIVTSRQGMCNLRERILAVLATAAAFAGLVGAAATPAAAVWPWITGDQILSITNPKTALSVSTPVGTVQVRYGTYGGKQYGWGRVVNPTVGYNLIFEVDLNGDRIRDDRDDWSVNLSLPNG